MNTAVSSIHDSRMAGGKLFTAADLAFMEVILVVSGKEHMF